MTSERQHAANRRNALRSTGPRTVLGKATSRQNALRHGLSARLGTDSEEDEQIEALARILAGREPSSGKLQYARIAASASLQIARIRALRTTLLEPAAREREVFSWSMPRRVRWQRHYKASNEGLEQLAVEVSKDIGDERSFGARFFQLAAPLQRNPPIPTGPEAPLVILERFISKIVKLDRYEDRELSRRRAALRALEALEPPWATARGELLQNEANVLSEGD